MYQKSDASHLKSGEVLLHVAPAQQPHLVMRLVVVELDGIRVCADSLEKGTTQNQITFLKTATEFQFKPNLHAAFEEIWLLM